MAESNLAPALRPRRARGSGSTTSRASCSRPASSPRLMDEDAVVGVTSNPTIFQQAIAERHAYDEQLRELHEHESDAEGDLPRARARDIDAACDLLRPSGTHGGPRRLRLAGGRPEPRRRPRRRPRRGQRLHALDRPAEPLRQDPGDAPGLAAIEDTIAAGKPINVTLIFSLQRHREVAEAYLRGLERLVAAGGDPPTVRSVASFFVSRVDTEADKRLDAIGGHDELKGKLAIANAKLAYQHYQELFSGDRWEASPARARRRSAACGPRPRRRTRPTAT